jgi:Zn-dependent metalloprotease
MALPWLLALLVGAHEIKMVSARVTHFLSGNLSSIEFPSKNMNYQQSIVSSVAKGQQIYIKSEVSKTIKSILRSHFQFTGRETILPTLDDIETDSQGRWHIRFKQYVDGLQIEGASLMAHIDPVSGTLIAVNGEFHSAATIGTKLRSTDSELSCDSAMEIALQEYGSLKGEWQSECTEAAVQGRDGKAHRAFKRMYGYQPTGVDDPFQLDTIFADRMTGKLLNVHPQVMGARSLSTFDCRRREGGPSDCKLLSSSPDKIVSQKKAAEDAHNSAVDAYDFFKNFFDRDSFDGKGGTIRSFTNYGSFYNNAFYSGVFGGMVYGNGDGKGATLPVLLHSHHLLLALSNALSL